MELSELTDKQFWIVYKAVDDLFTPNYQSDVWSLYKDVLVEALDRAPSGSPVQSVFRIILREFLFFLYRYEAISG